MLRRFLFRSTSAVFFRAAAAVFLAGLAGQADGQTLTRVVADGDDAPDDPAPFVDVNDAYEINDLGQVLFHASMNRNDVNGALADGVFYWQDGTIHNVEADAMENTSKLVAGVFQTHPRLNDAGQIVYLRYLEDGPDVAFNDQQFDDTNNSVLRRYDIATDTYQTLVREGPVADGGSGAPGLPGLYFHEYDTRRPFIDEMWLNDQGQVAFSAEAVNGDGSQFVNGIWVWDGSSGDLRVRQGDPSPVADATIAGFSLNQQAGSGLEDFNNAGAVALKAFLEGPGVDWPDDVIAMTRDSAGNDTLLLQEDRQSTQNDKVDSVRQTRLTNTGSAFVYAIDAGSGWPEIWSDAQGAGMQQIVISGPSGPELPDDAGFGNNARLETINPRWDVNDNDQLVFAAPIEEDVFFSPSGLGSGLFMWDDGQLRTILTDQTPIAGLDGQTLELDNVEQLAVNDRGEIALITNLLQDASADVLVGMDADGNAQALLTEDQTLGGFGEDGTLSKQVIGFNLASDIDVPGLTTLNNRGELLFNVNFTDGTSALYLTSVPEPASVILLFGGLPLLLRRRG